MASIPVENIKPIAHLVMRGWIPATQWNIAKINRMIVDNGPLMAHLRDEKFTQAFFILGSILRKTTIPWEDIKTKIPEVTLTFVENHGFPVEALHEFLSMTLAQYIAEYIGVEIKLADSKSLTVAQQYEIAFIFIVGWIKALLGRQNLDGIYERMLKERLPEKPIAEAYEAAARWCDESYSYERIRVRFPEFRNVCKMAEPSLIKIAKELKIERQDLVLALFKEAYVNIVVKMTRTS